MADYYELLEVPKNASEDEIKTAYRRKAVKYHPDKNPSKEAEAKFREITEAYDTLMDATKRQQYDSGGMNSFGGQNPFSSFYNNRSSPFGFSFRTGNTTINVEDLFREFNMGMHEENHAPRKTKGQDLKIHLNLTLDECYMGTTKKIALKHTVACKSCQGTGFETTATCNSCHGTGNMTKGFYTSFRVPCSDCSGRGITGTGKCADCNGTGSFEDTTAININVPAGVGEGNNLRLQGQGNAGTFGGPPGDLYVYVKELPHETIKRNGINLQMEVFMTMSEACLGARKTIQFLGDEVFKYSIEKGSQSGSVEKVKGKGMPNPRSSIGTRGDLYITRRLITPENLSPETKALFEQLSVLEHSDENKKDNKDE